MAYFILITVILLVISYVLFKPRWREFQRDKVRARVFKKAWRTILQQRVPYFRQMPTDLQLQLKQHIQVFLAEKRFVGCNGIKITDEIRITVAAQACLLLLNRRTDYYPKLRTIVIYPRAFIKTQIEANVDGIFSQQRSVLAGESWTYGQVVLSWQDTVAGADAPNDGKNVVIHEFAHQLDQEKGQANGAPILGKRQNYHTWSSILATEFDNLQRHASAGIPSLFDYYGATNPAEFFAVASEVFFEQAQQLAVEFPDLYGQLRDYYKVDPIVW